MEPETEESLPENLEWEFDHYSGEHWKELKAGKVDKTRSWVESSVIR